MRVLLQAVDSHSLLECQQQVLRPLLRQFSADDVFNLDETGLFWQLLPNKTMAFREEQCTGGKKSKQRITLLVGANMSGSEKFPLLVIGNPGDPGRVQGEFEGVDNGGAFRGDVACVGRTTRPAGTQSAGLSR